VEETLLAATSGGAELCGVADERGWIAPVYVFDAVVLDEEPCDLSRFDVTGVFRSGSAVVGHPRVAEAVA
jgi:cytosine/adenosine deaminase-related metal-dependent hydrolase